LLDPNHHPTPTGDGEILVQYLTEIQLPTSVTIGIENESQTVGIEYHYNTFYDSLAVPITNSFAIRYTTISPTPGIEEYGKLGNLPLQTRMSVIYPNPFMQRTTISYQLASRGHISLSVYDAAGRLVSNLTEGVMEPGYYSIHWDGYDEHQRRVPAGVYFVKLSADDHQQVVKTVLLK
jgi:hypothetical protein